MAARSFKPRPGVLDTLRSNKDQTQSGAAGFVGCSLVSWRRWEGGANIQKQWVCKVAKKYKQKPAQIVFGWPAREAGLPDRAAPPGKYAAKTLELFSTADQTREFFESLGGVQIGSHHWAFEVTCSGMEPEIRKGDYALCHTKAGPNDGDVVLLYHVNGHQRCKRFFYSDGETPVVILEDLDKNAKPEVVPEHQVVAALPVVARFLEHPEQRDRGAME